MGRPRRPHHRHPRHRPQRAPASASSASTTPIPSGPNARLFGDPGPPQPRAQAGPGAHRHRSLRLRRLSRVHVAGRPRARRAATPSDRLRRCTRPRRPLPPLRHQSPLLHPSTSASASPPSPTGTASSEYSCHDPPFSLTLHPSPQPRFSLTPTQPNPRMKMTLN